MKNIIGNSSALKAFVFSIMTIGFIIQSNAQTAANISVTGASGNDLGNGAVFIVGDVVAASWDNGTDAITPVSSVTFDFTGFGGSTQSAGQTVSGGVTTYTASYTIVDDATDLDLVNNVNVTVNYDSNGAVADDTNSDVDNVAPTPVITSSTGTATNNNEIPVSIDFGEIVTGFAVGDITVSGGSIGSITDNTSVDGTYDFILTVTPGADATYTIDVAADVAADQASNNNLVATQLAIDYEEDVVAISGTPTVVEGAGLSFTLTRSTSVDPLTVVLTTAGGDANTTDGNDFTAETSASFADGQNSISVVVSTLDDNLAETLETVTVTITDNADYAVGTASATGTIQDTNDYNLDFGAVPADLPEDGQVATRDFILKLPDGVTAQTNLTFSYNVVYDNMTNDDTDLGAAFNAAATITAGQNQTTVTFRAKHDDFAEGDETMQLVLTTVASAGNNTYALTGTSQTATITDIDNVVRATATTRSEGDAGNLFTLDFVDDAVTAQRDFTISYGLSFTDADANDYSGLTGTAVISSGNNDESIGLAADDGWAEGDEYVTLTISDGSAATPKYQLDAQDNDEVLITDVDNTISIVGTGRTEGDADEMFVVSFPTNVGAQRAFTVDYVVSYPGSLGSAADHDAALDGDVVIPVGTEGVTSSVDIGLAQGDDLAEGDEDVTVTISDGSALTALNYQGTPNATSAITDLDNEIEIDAVDVTEEDGTPIFTFSFEDVDVTAERDFTVDYTVTNEA
ncbi:MAG: Ig-like domain-containing protein, partial [Cyclobacteriaceae bacterium]